MWTFHHPNVPLKSACEHEHSLYAIAGHESSRRVPCRFPCGRAIVFQSSPFRPRLSCTKKTCPMCVCRVQIKHTFAIAFANSIKINIFHLAKRWMDVRTDDNTVFVVVRSVWRVCLCVTPVRVNIRERMRQGGWLCVRSTLHTQIDVGYHNDCGIVAYLVLFVRCRANQRILDRFSWVLMCDLCSRIRWQCGMVLDFNASALDRKSTKTGYIRPNYIIQCVC